MEFKELNLSPLLLKALEKKGYSQPSPIQEQAIPYVLEKRDLLGCAQTGTGKTAAFALPIIQNLMECPRKRQQKKPIRALILTPTRELALQIADNIKEYGEYTPVKGTVIFGGVSAVPQIQDLRKGVDILVATPGRLNDLIGQREIDLSYVEIFVLDEADRMLDMGFIHDVKKVIALLPKKRQTLLFSATMPGEIQSLASKLLHNPVKVEVTPVSSTVDMIEISLYYVDKANKRKLLEYLLKHEDITSTLVFTRTKHGADQVSKYLTKAGINAAAIHGDKSQGARQTALNNFKSGKLRVLVATDIAARGIDIEELSCVINFDLPNISETYVHRIGRTGRAGLGGRALSFCAIEEKDYVRDIEKLIGKTIPVIEDHPYPMSVFEIAPKEETSSGRTTSSRRAGNAKRDASSPKAGNSKKASSSQKAASSRKDTSAKKSASPQKSNSTQKNNSSQKNTFPRKNASPQKAASSPNASNQKKSSAPKKATSLIKTVPVSKTAPPKEAAPNHQQQSQPPSSRRSKPIIRTLHSR